MELPLSNDLTQAVIDRMRQSQDPRFKAIMEALVRHLHALVRETGLTEDEWFTAIRFLTATGQKCDGKRQEYILLSDVLGVSMLVDAINHTRAKRATENTVLGPFFVEGAREIANGDNLAEGWPGELTFVSGRVVAADGGPVAGAMLEIWQADSEGWYDVQIVAGERQLRGKLRTDPEGRFSFRTIKPSPYPIPMDGPVGEILRRTGHHAMRPAHIHFIVSAPGYQTLVTHLFVAGDPYLESDAVFAVKDSLIVPFRRNESAREAEKLGLAAPFYAVNFDFVLDVSNVHSDRGIVTAASVLPAESTAGANPS